MEEEIRASVGARLREERESLGLSQTAFAALGAVSLRTEQDWERGVSSVKSDFLAVVADHGVDVLYVVTGVRGKPSPKVAQRLREEREAQGLTVAEFAQRAEISPELQDSYERALKHPDSEYFEAIAMLDIDVSYVLTGHRMLMQSMTPAQPYERVPVANVLVASERSGQFAGGPRTIVRTLTPEEAALVDNYNAADEKGRAAARSVLDALAEPKKRANG